MKRYLCSILFVVFALTCMTSASEPFRGTFTSTELGLKMVIDLYSESIDVPEMEMFGSMNGYIKGTGLYRTWYVSSIRQCNETKAIIHFSNDLGSETQAVELTLQGDSLVRFRAIDGNVMKKSQGKKLVKIQTDFIMKRE